MQSPDISAKVDYEKDPLKIELGNIKQEAEVEDDPLKLEEILLDPIKSEPYSWSFEAIKKYLWEEI